MLGKLISSEKKVYENGFFVYWKEEEKFFQGKKKGHMSKSGRNINSFRVHKHTIKEVKGIRTDYQQNEKTRLALERLGIPLVRKGEMK